MSYNNDPITSIEKYLVATYDNSVSVPDPITRIESYLYSIVSGNASDLDPITNIEFYLAKISGADVNIPEPTTDIERFLAVIAGENSETPEPITRIEQYLADWIENGLGELTTVSGEYPLLLEDAMAKKIESFIQYGKCSQAYEPSALSPVDIKCNNGKLVMLDDELPSGYKRLLGLTYNNNVFYEITDFKMKGDDTLRFSFKCTMSSPACNVLGAYDGSSAQSNYSLYLGNSSSAKYLRYNGSTYRSDADVNETYNVVLTPTGSDGMKTDSTWTEKTFESDNNLCIGTTSPTATSSKMVGDIIGNVVVDGRLKLVPCERMSDNMLGYYDLISEAFYEPTGSGIVSMGDDISHLTVLSVVGTPEVITVEDQTASVESLLSVENTKDEQNIITGDVTRRCGVCIYDGTQDIGDVYVSTTGGKDVGAIIVYPLITSISEKVAEQILQTSEGDITVYADAEISGLEAEVKYLKSK